MTIITYLTEVVLIILKITLEILSASLGTKVETSLDMFILLNHVGYMHLNTFNILNITCSNLIKQWHYVVTNLGTFY